MLQPADGSSQVAGADIDRAAWRVICDFGKRTGAHRVCEVEMFWSFHMENFKYTLWLYLKVRVRIGEFVSSKVETSVCHLLATKDSQRLTKYYRVYWNGNHS